MDLIHNSGSDFVKVTIDSFDNITIKETSNIAKRIKNDDSILSMFPNGCRLEVTTPGIGSNLVKSFNIKKILVEIYYLNIMKMILALFVIHFY